MIKKKLIIGLNFALIIFVTSCSKTIDIKDLQGKWNYISIKNADTEDIITDAEVKIQNPSIFFSSNNDLIIEWGAKQISHGKFRLEGKIIRYTEFLEDGRTREFPFLIIELNESDLVFQTMEKNFTRVSAKKNAIKL